MILNKTKKHRDRYRVINGKMGSHGQSPNSPNHKYEIVNGIDNGNGYQGYSAVSYFLTKEDAPQEAKDNLIDFLLVRGYKQWLKKNNLYKGS